MSENDLVQKYTQIIELSQQWLWYLAWLLYNWHPSKVLNKSCFLSHKRPLHIALCENETLWEYKDERVSSYTVMDTPSAVNNYIIVMVNI